MTGVPFASAEICQQLMIVRGSESALDKIKLKSFFGITVVY